MKNNKYMIANIPLDNPLVLASSPATEYFKHLKDAAKAGVAAAILKSCLPVKNLSSDVFKTRQFKQTKRGLWGNSSIERELLAPQKAMSLFEETISHSKMLVIPSIAGFSLNPDEWLDTLFFFETLKPPCIQLDLFYIKNELSLPDSLEKLENLLKTLSSNTNIPLIPKLNCEIRPVTALKFLNNSGIKGWSLLDSIRLNFPIRLDNPTIMPVDHFSKYVEKASLFGSWQFPITCDYTYYLSSNSKLPVLAGGGVTNSHEVKTLISLGAKAVQIATPIIREGTDWIRKTLDDLTKDNDLTFDIQEENYSRKIAVIDTTKCHNCGSCIKQMMCNSIEKIKERHYINRNNCEGCGFCLNICKHGAINLKKY